MKLKGFLILFAFTFGIGVAAAQTRSPGFSSDSGTKSLDRGRSPGYSEKGINSRAPVTEGKRVQQCADRANKAANYAKSKGASTSEARNRVGRDCVRNAPTKSRSSSSPNVRFRDDLH